MPTRWAVIAIGSLLALASGVPIARGEDAVLALTPGEMRWAAVSGYPPGYGRAMLEGQADKAVPFTYRVRLPAHFKFQPHTHAYDEHVTVLEGAWSFGVGDVLDASRLRALPAGSYVTIPAGTPHFVVTESETIVQVHGMGPIGFRPVGHPGTAR